MAPVLLLAIALIVLGLIAAVAVPGIGWIVPIVGLVLLVPYLFGFGRRAFLSLNYLTLPRLVLMASRRRVMPPRPGLVADLGAARDTPLACSYARQVGLNGNACGQSRCGCFA